MQFIYSKLISANLFRSALDNKNIFFPLFLLFMLS